jgi:glycosyltransferase involved in cell wall biosynthesis
MRKFFDLPNVSIEVIEDCWRVSGKATARLYEVLRHHRPGILHLYYTGFLSAYPWLARIMGTSQVYFTDQSSQAEGFVPTRAPLWKRLPMRVINRPIDGVVSVSKYGYDNFTTRDLLPKERFHIIYNSVDVNRAALGIARAAEFRGRFHIGADRLVVTQVSWLIPEKGLDDLLLAARDVLAAEPRAHFLLVGEGAHRANLERQCGELGIAGQVTFTGSIHDPLAEGVYAASDVVCQMSRWEEVFGYVNAEAMASGKPLVGTRVGGIPELIEDGVNGYLTPRRDPPAAAARILALLKDSELRRRMGQAGRKLVEQKFSHKENIAQVIRLYGI